MLLHRSLRSEKHSERNWTPEQLKSIFVIYIKQNLNTVLQNRLRYLFHTKNWVPACRSNACSFEFMGWPGCMASNSCKNCKGEDRQRDLSTFALPICVSSLWLSRNTVCSELCEVNYWSKSIASRHLATGLLDYRSRLSAWLNKSTSDYSDFFTCSRYYVW